MSNVITADQVQQARRNQSAREKSPPGYELSVETPLGKIVVHYSGNFKHREMIENFLAKIKQEA